MKKTLDYLTKSDSISNPASLISTPIKNDNKTKSNISLKNILDETFSSNSNDNKKNINIASSSKKNDANNTNQSSVFAKFSLTNLTNLNKICSICKRPIENLNNKNLLRKFIFKNVDYRPDSIMQCSDCTSLTCKTCGDFVNINSIKVSIDKPVI